MSSRVNVLVRELPRGKLVRVCLDISCPGPRNYAVAVYQGPAGRQGRQTFTLLYVIKDLTRDEADSWAEFQDQLPGPQEDSSWRAVLDRLTGKAQLPVRWQGSPAEYASRYFEIGTWEWVQTLVLMRANQDRAAA